MSKYIILDTETNGLPVCKAFGFFPLYTDTVKYDNSRIVQVSFVITDKDYNKLEEFDTIIKMDNFKIENHQFHGITEIISETQGIPFVTFANEFSNALDTVDTIIAHNIDFDFNVLCAEFFRYSLFGLIEKMESKRQICTMKRYKNIVGATFKNNNFVKYPSLKELYKFATNEDIQNQHNSMHDTLNLWRAVKIIEFTLNGGF